MSDQRNEMSRSSDRPLVLVTGSSGMLGDALLRRRSKDLQFVGFDFAGNTVPVREAEGIDMDLGRDESVDASLERVAFAYGTSVHAVVHLAAYVDFSSEDSPMYDKVTVEGSRRLLDKLHEKGFEVGRFIFSSSMLAHEPTEPGDPIDEDSALGAKWGYPQSKIDAENVIREHAGDYPTTFLRIAGVYTKDCGAPTLAQQMHRIYESSLKSHVLPGNPERGQAFVHLEDTLDALERAIDKPDAQPKRATYLIGEPETFTYQELQDAMGEALHGAEEWKTIRVPEELAEVGAATENYASRLPGVSEPFIKPFMIDMADDHYEIDISLARKDLGWEPKHRLLDEIPAMCQRLKDDPAAWRKKNGIES